MTTGQPSDASTRPVPPTMLAAVQARYGTPEVLDVREVPTPQPGPGQALIRVEASSLNMYDWHMITGTPYMARSVAGWTRPKHPTPGADVAGVVVGLGPDVSGLSIGDEVYGEIGFGSFAGYALADPKSIAPKPVRIDFEAAASVPLAGLTALQGLRDVGGVEPGLRVIVNGASGGVGTFAVQIAKALGAEVTAVCSTSKLETARAIGADKVIDYTTGDFTESERGYHVLFDNAGTRSWSSTRRVLVDGGINVTTTGPKHAVLGPFRNLVARKIASRLGPRRFTWFTAAVRRTDLDTLATMIDDGRVTPVIESRYPLPRIAEALARLGEGHAAGKLTISMDH